MTFEKATNDNDVRNDSCGGVTWRKKLRCVEMTV